MVKDMEQHQAKLEPIKKEATRAKVLDLKVSTLEKRIKSMTEKYDEYIKNLKKDNANYQTKLTVLIQST